MICKNCKNEVDDFLDQDSICPFCHKNLNYSDENYNLDDGFSENNIEKIKDAETFSLGKVKKNFLPVSTISFFFMHVLFLIPIINLFFLFLFSFKNNINENRKAFARSILVWYALFCTALLALIATLLVLHYPLDLYFWFTKFKEMINNIPDF